MSYVIVVVADDVVVKGCLKQGSFKTVLSAFSDGQRFQGAYNVHDGRAGAESKPKAYFRTSRCFSALNDNGEKISTREENCFSG